MNAAPKLLAAVLLGSAGAQELVAHRVDFDAIRWAGVESFAPWDVYRALLRAEEAPAEMHVANRLDRLVEWLEEEITAGYLASGFADVQVAVEVGEDDRLIHVLVEEGAQVRAGPISIETDSASLESAVREELEDPEQDLLWMEGGPARLGPRATFRIREIVKACCLRQGLLRAQVTVNVESIHSGALARLRVKVTDTTPSRIGPVMLVGCPESLADEALAAVEHDPERPATLEALRRLEGALYETGRFAVVQLSDPTPDGRPRVDPLVVRVAPSSLDSAPTPGERRDLGLLREAAEGVARRLASGEHLEVDIRSESAPGEGGLRMAAGTHRFRADRSQLLLRTTAASLGKLELGCLQVQFGESTGLVVESERLGRLLRIAVENAGSAVTVLRLSLSAVPSVAARESEETIAFRWGFGLQTKVPQEHEIEGLPRHVALTPDTWSQLWLAAPAVVDLLRRPSRSSSDEDRLELRFPDREFTLRVDRGSRDVTVTSDEDTVGVRIAPGPVSLPPLSETDTDLGSALALLRRDGTGVESADLVALATALLGELGEITFDRAEWRGPGFVIPARTASSRQAHDGQLENLGLMVASNHPALGWPHVLAVEAAGLVFGPDTRAPRFSAELHRLEETDACGPLGWFAFAALARVLGADNVTSSCLRECRETLRFEQFWADLERLTVGSDLLDRIGARWRTDAATRETELAHRIEECVDDRAAAKVGMDALWRTVLAKALLDLLAQIERD